MAAVAPAGFEAPGFEERVRAAFARQGFMRTLDARIIELAAGRCAIECAFRADLTQHHGLFHAGVLTTLADNACGFATMSLLPPGGEVLSVEFKTSFLRPAAGVAVVARGEVVKPGRTILLAEARDILARAAEAPLLARRAAAGEVGALALGFSGSCAYAFLPVAVEGFRRTHPAVELTLREMAAERQIEQLREARLDLCLMRGTGVPPGLAGALVFEEALVVALPRANPLSARAQVSPAELAPHPFVTFPRDAGNGYHHLVTEICAAAGFTPRLAQEVSPMHALIGLVAAGVGVAIVPASVRKLHFSGVVYRRLAAVETRSQVWAVWRPDRLPAPARAFATGIGAVPA